MDTMRELRLLMLKANAGISEENSIQGIKGLGLHRHYVHH